MRSTLTLLSLFLVSTLFGQTKQELDSLTKVLETIYALDQTPRAQLDTLEKQYGFNSDQIKEQWKLIVKNDSANIQIVTAIVNKYGWLSATRTSKTANRAIFLVIQHAPLEIQEKYMNTLKQAVKDGNAKPSQYA